MEQNCAVREATGDYIIQHMHIACWITKATDTLTICNTYSFPTTTVVTQMHRSVILYILCLSCLMCHTGHPKYPATRHHIVGKEVNIIKTVVENQLCYVHSNFLGGVIWHFLCATSDKVILSELLKLTLECCVENYLWVIICSPLFFLSLDMGHEFSKL